MATITERPTDIYYTLEADKRDADRVFDIVAANPIEAATIAETNGPQIGSPHPTFTFLWVKRMQLRSNNGSPTAYILYAHYESPGGFSVDGNPTTLPTKWDWSDGITSVHIDRDLYGNPLVNSANDPFDNGMGEVPSCSVTGSKYMNASAFRPRVYMSYLGGVNGDYVVIQGDTFEPGSLRINAIHPAVTTVNGTNYVELSVTMEYSPKGFQFTALDQGYNYYQSDGAANPTYTRTQITVDGDPSRTPGLLNGYGGQLTDPVPSGNSPPSGATVIPALVNNQTVANYLTYQTANYVTFGTLPIF